MGDMSIAYLSTNNVHAGSGVPAEVGSRGDGTRRHGWGLVVGRNEDAVVRERRERRLVLFSCIWVQHRGVYPQRAGASTEPSRWRRRADTTRLVRRERLLALRGNTGEQRCRSLVGVAVGSGPSLTRDMRRAVVLAGLRSGTRKFGVDEAATLPIRTGTGHPECLSRTNVSLV